MLSNKVAMLCMPTDGHVTPHASWGFWRASRALGKFVPELAFGSILTTNFNGLWAAGLNYKFVHGQQLDYWAMQHDDVGPEDWWLDLAIEEMERFELDVVGVSLPIKDDRTLTSIALDRSKEDEWYPWRPLCRLTQKELFRLPETFTADDTGHPLLINTGLWVVRFDESWVKEDIAFHTQDKIIYDTNQKKFIAICEPEDWNISRQFNALGLRVGVTRKIKSRHQGNKIWHNQDPTGAEFDEEFIDHSVIPNDGFVLPEDVLGWLTPNEGRKLWELARGKRVLEIGSYCGLSTICMAQSCYSLDSVDPHDSRGTPGNIQTLAQFVKNLIRYKVNDKVSVHECTFREFTVTDDKLYDLIFIDGAHDYESVKSDITDAQMFLAPDGLIVFHDYRNGIDPGVDQAVDEFLAMGDGELLFTCDTLAVVSSPVAIPEVLAKA